MKIVVIGVGTVGQELVGQLSKEGHDIIVIDSDSKKLEYAVNAFDVKGIMGNGASFDVLTEAEITSCDLLIASTPSDEVNILCCMVAKKLGAHDTIARVRSPEYFTLFKGKELGLSMMVNPEYETALEISRMLRFNTAIKVEPFADGKVDMVEIKVTEKTGLVGVALKDLHDKLSVKVLICAVERGGKVYIPSGTFLLKQDDNIYLTASSANVSEFFKEISDTKVSRSAMIVGGSKTAFYLAKELRKQGVKVKIIENNMDKCQALSETLDKVEIIHGDGTDQEVLSDEGLSRTDAFITLCGTDEQNIILAMFAKSKKVKKVICKTEKSSYFKMLREGGIDSVVSTRTTTADQIVRYVRAKQSSRGGSVDKLYRIVNDQAEALEFTVRPDFKALGTPLKSIKLAKNLLIATIIRNDEIIVPDGDSVILEGDSVIVVTTNEFSDELNDILE